MQTTTRQFPLLLLAIAGIVSMIFYLKNKLKPNITDFKMVLIIGMSN